MFGYHNIRTTSYCKVPETFCRSKSLVNIQIDGNYCFLWCILAHKYYVDKELDTVAHYKKSFTEFIQSEMLFPVKIK